jgi:hypothetical protein
VGGYCEHGNESSDSILSSCTTGGFSRRAQLHEVSLVHSMLKHQVNVNKRMVMRSGTVENFRSDLYFVESVSQFTLAVEHFRTRRMCKQVLIIYFYI